MSVPNPYSDIKVPTYFNNEAFEPEQSPQTGPDAELKEKVPTNFLYSGTASSTQQNGAPAKSPPVVVPNPYGSMYRSPQAGGSKQPESQEEETPPCFCCKLCKCCRCCLSCTVS